jgi:hypothetical protein
MSRVKRRLFSLLVALSLILCIAIAAVWVRSYSASDQVSLALWTISAQPGGRWSVTRTWEGKTGPGQFYFDVETQKVWQDEKEYVVYRPRLTLRWMPDFPFRIGHAVETPWTERGFLSTWQPLYRDNDPDWVRMRSQYGVGFPCWLALIVTAVLPTWRLIAAVTRRRTHARRAAAGHCIGCGYDLRRSTDRCPECGAVPAASRSEDSLSKSTADEPVHGV